MQAQKAGHHRHHFTDGRRLLSRSPVPSPEPSRELKSCAGVLEGERRHSEFPGEAGSTLSQRRAPSRRKQSIAATPHNTGYCQSARGMLEYTTARGEQEVRAPSSDTSVFLLGKPRMLSLLQGKSLGSQPPAAEKTGCRFFCRGGLGRQDTPTAPSPARKQPEQ